MDGEEIKSFLERTDDLGTRLTGEDKETFARVVCGYNQCTKLLKETEQKVEEQQKDYLEALRVKHERAYEIAKMKEQQKEFIEYMNKTIEELECDDVDDEEMKGYLIQRIDTFKEILSKYKEIIGYKDEQN